MQERFINLVPIFERRGGQHEITYFLLEVGGGSPCSDDKGIDFSIFVPLTLTGLEGHICPSLVRDGKDIYVLLF